MAVTPEAKQKAIEAFRRHLTARGLRAYILTDDEVWRWIQRVIQDFERHRASVYMLALDSSSSKEV